MKIFGAVCYGFIHLIFSLSVVYLYVLNFKVTEHQTPVGCLHQATIVNSSVKNDLLCDCDFSQPLTVAGAFRPPDYGPYDKSYFKRRDFFRWIDGNERILYFVDAYANYGNGNIDLHAVQVAVITHCKNISQIGTSIFMMPNLRNFSINLGNISRLQRGSFEVGTTVLYSLNLRTNKIYHIDDGCFRRMSALQNLHIDENELKKFDWVWFEGLRILRSLTISHNKMQNWISFNLETVSFSEATNDGHFPQLSLIDVSFNLLTSVEDEFAKIAPNLEHFNADSNLLEFIGRYTFSNLKKLRILSLRGNRLKTVYHDWFSSVQDLRQWEEIGISDNQWRCDDKMLGYSEFLVDIRLHNDSNVRKLGESMKIICSSPDCRKGLELGVELAYCIDRDICPCPLVELPVVPVGWITSSGLLIFAVCVLIFVFLGKTMLHYRRKHLLGSKYKVFPSDDNEQQPYSSTTLNSNSKSETCICSDIQTPVSRIVETASETTQSKKIAAVSVPLFSNSTSSTASHKKNFSGASQYSNSIQNDVGIDESTNDNVLPVEDISPEKSPRGTYGFAMERENRELPRPRADNDAVDLYAQNPKPQHPGLVRTLPRDSINNNGLSEVQPASSEDVEPLINPRVDSNVDFRSVVEEFEQHFQNFDKDRTKPNSAEISGLPFGNVTLGSNATDALKPCQAESQSHVPVTNADQKAYISHDKAAAHNTRSVQVRSTKDANNQTQTPSATNEPNKGELLLNEARPYEVAKFDQSSAFQSRVNDKLSKQSASADSSQRSDPLKSDCAFCPPDKITTSQYINALERKNCPNLTVLQPGKQQGSCLPDHGLLTANIERNRSPVTTVSSQPHCDKDTHDPILTPPFANSIEVPSTENHTLGGVESAAKIERGQPHRDNDITTHDSSLTPPFANSIKVPYTEDQTLRGIESAAIIEPDSISVISSFEVVSENNVNRVMTRQDNFQRSCRVPGDHELPSFIESEGPNTSKVDSVHWVDCLDGLSSKVVDSHDATHECDSVTSTDHSSTSAPPGCGDEFSSETNAPRTTSLNSNKMKPASSSTTEFESHVDVGANSSIAHSADLRLGQYEVHSHQNQSRKFIPVGVHTYSFAPASENGINLDLVRAQKSALSCPELSSPMKTIHRQPVQQAAQSDNTLSVNSNVDGKQRDPVSVFNPLQRPLSVNCPPGMDQQLPNRMVGSDESSLSFRTASVPSLYNSSSSGHDSAISSHGSGSGSSEFD